MYTSHRSQAMRGILKRKFADVDDSACYSSSSSSSSPPSSLSSPGSSEWESDGESADDQDFTPHSPPSATASPIRSILRRPEFGGTQSNVRFDQVTVFSFPRCQGFTSVPSRGGATLGMRHRHSTLQSYTLAEHALERRHRRRERLRVRLREERLQTLKHRLITSGAVDQREADTLTVDQIPDDDVHISDADLEDGAFLQPYSSRQRQALLQEAGVKRIDREEKKQLHALRFSREACGCDCRGFCEPETCACSLAGIKCQVDRFSFPCGCTKDGCGNTLGRVEFNSRRVRTHYIHTTMRLELERRLQDETRGQKDQTPLPGALQEHEDQDQACAVQSTQDKTCPFGFTMEEDGLSLTVPAVLSLQFIPERPVAEENSCSSDMTDSSSSSSSASDAGGGLSGSQAVAEVGGGLSRALSICDDNDQHSQHNQNRTSLTGYLDENANQARDFFSDDSLEDFPNTPSPTVDYSSGMYTDLSLSSESDLEFFDSDCMSGPLHSSFRLHGHSDSLCPLQLFSCGSPPQHESGTHLLESLIGLTEPSPEQAGPL